MHSFTAPNFVEIKPPRREVVEVFVPAEQYRAGAEAADKSSFRRTG